MSKFKFLEKAKKFRIAKQIALEKMANNAVRYFKVDGFDKESFDGNDWAKRKDNDASRKLMVKTGRLRESITILGRTEESRKIGTTVPYAEYHNKGTERLPKRQIIGKSKELDKQNFKTLKTTLKGIL